MRFDIEKESLQQAIEVAILAVDTKEQDIRSAFLIEVEEDDGMVIWATNRQMMTKVPLQVREGSRYGKGKFTVDADRLRKWVKHVVGDVVEVEVEGRSVKMTCGEAVGHFASRDPVEFPNFQNQLHNATKLFSASPESFVDALDFVTPFIGDATSNNDIANNMQVAELRGREMMATNAMSVALFVLEEENESLDAYVENLEDPEWEKDHAFKIGAREIKNLSAFLKRTCTDKFVVSKKDVFIVESDDGSVFGYNTPIYSLPKISGIPKGLDEAEVWQLSKTDLRNAVSGLSATADPMDQSLRISCGEGDGLELRMKDALEQHDSTYRIAFNRETSTGEALEFKVNKDLLVQPLSLYSNEMLNLGVSVGTGAKYVKYYEKTESGNTRVCIVTLRMR